MNIPILKGYFRYPSLAYQRTRGYFAAFPALLPVSAIIEYSGTNTLLNASATFDGQSVPVVSPTYGMLEARFTTKLQDIGRQIDLQWTLQFAQKPTTVRYTHRVLVTGVNTAVNPIPSLTGNPCNIPCENAAINVPFTNPLYFAVTSTNTGYEGFDFESPLINGNVLENWCNLIAAGAINIEPYHIPNYTENPTWTERQRFCLFEPPRTNAQALIVEIDTNINSPTFGEIRTRTEIDTTLCPLDDTEANWEDVSLPECQPEPRTDCRKQVTQQDTNPISPTYGTTRTIILPPTPTDCEDCPPTSTLPDYQDTGEWRCVQPELGRVTSLAEKKQVDRNPFSPTFGNEQWVTIGLRPDLCPIDPDPCNQEVWIDVQDENCNPVTRCKFDPPRTNSTRQKKQIQVNNRLPNFGTIRWVDLPPSPQDAVQCPVESCPIFVPVCPEEIRCKEFAPPMTERLVVDVNPNSATFGQQSWVDYEPNPTLCPFASQRSISSATLYACQQPNDYIPNCISFYFVPGNNTDFNNNFGLFDISPGPNEIRERWDLARTTWELPLFSPGTIGTPNWLDCGFTNGTQEFRTSTRFDDVIHWAKVYHYQRAQFDVSNAVLFHVFVSTLIDLNQVTATLETYNSSNVSLGIVPVQNVDNLGLAAYNIYYTIDCSTNPSLNFVPHKNRTVVPDEVLPPGHVLRFAYVPPFINSIGLFRFKHNVFINGELYASQSGWIKNI